MIKRVFKIILIASAIILFLDTMQNKLAVNAALREAKVTEVLNGNLYTCSQTKMTLVEKSIRS